MEHINSGEIMLEIPQKLMICEPVCKKSKEIGHVFQDTSLFRFGGVGSELIAVFLMHETLRGEKSFWYVTLCIHSKKQAYQLVCHEQVSLHQGSPRSDNYM